jgi:hypothetical protein
MYLQLAEGTNDGNYSELAESADNVLDMYVFIPANFLPEFNKDTYVRADYFNKYDAATADAILNALNQYQTSGTLNEGLVQGALNFIPGVGPIASKGLGVAKALLQKRQEKVSSGTAKPLFKPGGKIANLIAKVKPQAQQIKAAQEEKKGPILPTEPVGATVQLPSGSFNVGFNPAEQPAAAQQTFFQKYKTPLLIGGGLLAVGGIYLLMKRKK